MNFDQRVYRVLEKVPKGKVTTYKEIARVLNTKAYRAVGQALRRNEKPIIIPCHRVVSNDGRIGGFAGKTDPSSLAVKRKIRLLRSEGVEIKNNKINLEKYLYRLRP